MKMSLSKSLTSDESVVASEKKDPRKTLRDVYSDGDFMVINIPAIHHFSMEKCFFLPSAAPTGAQLAVTPPVDERH